MAKRDKKDEALAERQAESPSDAPPGSESDVGAGQEAPPERAPWSKRLRSYALQALVVVAVLWGVTWWQARRLLPTRAEAPDFQLSALDGTSYRLQHARGRKVVLYFFAPWCTVCEFSSSNVRGLREARSEEELAVYAIGLGWDEPSELAGFAREHELNVPVLKGSPQVQRNYRIDTFPSVYIIDEQGRIEDRVVGYTTELGLRLRSL